MSVQDWTRTPGPRSHRRWVNLRTQEIVYSDTNPGADPSRDQDAAASATATGDKGANAKAGGKPPQSPARPGGIDNNRGRNAPAGPASAPSAAPAPRPVNNGELTHTALDRVRDKPGGANAGGIYRDAHDGSEWLIKQSQSDDHARNEVLAASLYRLAGVQTPDVRIFRGADGRQSVASKWMNDAKPISGGDTTHAARAAEGFAADAWLGNWDAAGDGNLFSTGNGGVIRGDVGGALRFRAKGEPKGEAFGSSVTETKTLRDRRKNPAGAAMFGKMSDEDVEKSVANVLKVSDDDIRKAVDQLGPDDQGEREKLADTLIARKKDLARQYPGAAKRVPKPPRQSPEEAAADYKANGVRAASFKSWFGDWESDPRGASKVVDPATGEPSENFPFHGQGSVVKGADGAPMVVYHGSSAKFDAFDPNKAATGVVGKGFYFTGDQGRAATYNKAGDQGKTYSVFLNIRKPFDLSRDYTPAEYEAITGKKWGLFKKIGRALGGGGPGGGAKPTTHISGRELYSEIASRLSTKRIGEDHDAANAHLRSLGFDGITHTDGEEGQEREPGAYGKGKGNRVWVAWDPRQVKSVENRGTFDSNDERMDFSERWTAEDERNHPRGNGGKWAKKTDTPEFRRWFGASKIVDSEGNPLVVYHGTNRSFDAFSAGKQRTARNEHFQGDGFFFTSDPQTAAKYADAAANQSFDKDTILAEVDVKYPGFPADMFRGIIERGYSDGWEWAIKKHGLEDALASEWPNGGIDLNELADIAKWVEGSRSHGSDDDEMSSLSLFGGRTWIPEYITEQAAKLGLTVPASQTVPVYLSAQKVLRTNDPAKAKAAKAKGYDGVYYTGPGRVGDAPEWIVFSPTQIKSAIANSGAFDPSDNRIAFSEPESEAITVEFFDEMGRGPREGERNAAGLIFRNHRWRREGERRRDDQQRHERYAKREAYRDSKRPGVTGTVAKHAVEMGKLAAGVNADFKQIVGGVVNSLPKPISSPAKTLYAAYSATFNAAQATVKEVAKARGLTDEAVAKIAWYTASADYVVANTAGWLGTMAGMGWLTKRLAGFVPLGSLAYLTVSLAKNPVITLKAITQLVIMAVGKVGTFAEGDETGGTGGNDRETIGTGTGTGTGTGGADRETFRREFAEWLASLGESERDDATCAFMVAMDQDEVGGDWQKAMDVASEVMEERGAGAGGDGGGGDADDADGDADGDEPATFAESDWTREPTARTQNRWRHKVSGRIAYGKENPGASKAKGGKAKATADQTETPRKTGWRTPIETVRLRSADEYQIAKEIADKHGGEASRSWSKNQFEQGQLSVTREQAIDMVRTLQDAESYYQSIKKPGMAKASRELILALRSAFDKGGTDNIRMETQEPHKGTTIEISNPDPIAGKMRSRDEAARKAWEAITDTEQRREIGMEVAGVPKAAWRIATSRWDQITGGEKERLIEAILERESQSLRPTPLSNFNIGDKIIVPRGGEDQLATVVRKDKVAVTVRYDNVENNPEQPLPRGKNESWYMRADGPRDGDRNADGLVFRAGRWHREEPPAPQPAPQPKSPHVALADDLSALIRSRRGEPITAKELFAAADRTYGGTRAEGKYGPSDAYDALEAGVNLALEGQTDPRVSLDAAKRQVAQLEALTNSLPTQTNRSGNKDSFQQFSTPPHLAYAVNWIANIGDGDTALEPSGGTGSIAIHAANANADVYANELDSRRADLLRNLFHPSKITTENAEQIGGILPARGIRPTVVVMNPPFSATAGRLGDKKVTTTGAKHIEEALATLQPGGRLVAIVGRGMSPSAATFKPWFRKIGGEYNIAANVGLSGKNYKKYGTQFDNRIIVIDKIPPTGKPTVTGDFETIPAMMEAMEGVRNDRQRIGSGNSQSSGVPAGSSGNSLAQGGNSGARHPSARSGSVASGENSGAGDGRGVHRVESGADAAGSSGANVRGGTGNAGGRSKGSGTGQSAGDSGGASGSTGGDGAGRRPGKPRAASRGKSSGKSASQVQLRPATSVRLSDGPKEGDRNAAGLVFHNGRWHREEEIEATSNESLGDSLFEQYSPTKANVEGSQPHNTAIVESAAMAAVEPPNPTYRPVLSPDIVEKGILSDAQLEAVVYAGQAHSRMLPARENETAFRRGFFIGDGTGVGKGREIAGVIADNLNQGRKRHVWVSMNNNLFEDAQRDIAALGIDPNKLFEFGDLKKKDAPKDGIIFITYGTLRSGPKDKSKPNNLASLIGWLGKDFDGVIAFDEAHNLGNATDTEGTRGKKKASQTAIAGVDLQKALPDARMLYVSATGATEVENLAYCERLGIWGYGTPFQNKIDFIAAMKNGGVAAMEQVAQSLKSRGAYIARSLSFDGIGYDRMTWNLTDDQRRLYDDAAAGWQKVLQNLGKAIELTGVSGKERSNALSQFWGGQQRFFNQLITSLQIPALIAAIDADKDENGKPKKSHVIQLVNTNEAALDRAVKGKDEETEIEDLDVSPKQMLLQYLEKAFPVERYEEYEDEDGNIKKRMVVDSQGNPVLDPDAAAMRDALYAEINTNMKGIDSPIDQILNYYGTENVAECTGRSMRKVYKTDERGRRAMVIEKRNPDAAKSAETEAFMDGKKKILVFSDAGGTGRSYHADRNAANQTERVHYLLQPGWRADKAVQGLGRTHRTNEAQPPVYRLVQTAEIPGQRRFVSTIARRLDQLGALTRGQRQAGSTGLFKAGDNLESLQATQAMTQFFTDLHFNRIPGLDRDDVVNQMGLKKDEKNRQPATPDSTTQFLNRMLVLNLNTQSKVFDEFDKRLQEKVDQAIRDKTLDTGVENFPAQSLEKSSENVVYRDPESGSTVKHIVTKAKFSTERRPWEANERGEKPLGYVKNSASGQVWAVYNAGDKTDAKTGQVISQYLLRGPRTSSYKPRVDLNPGMNKYERIEATAAKELWDKQFAAAPEFTESDQHFVAGDLLNVWDRLPADSPKIYRLRTTDGTTTVGRWVPATDVAKVMQNLGVSYEGAQTTASDVFEKVKNGGRARLANNWRIVPSRVQNESRIEIKGPTTANMDSLKADGVIAERIGWEWRFFVPSGADGAKVLERVTKSRPITEVSEE